MAQFPYPDEGSTIKAYQDRVRMEYQAAGRLFPDPNDPDAFRWFTRYGYSCGDLPEPQAADRHIAELHAALNPGQQPQPGQPVDRPLVGPLRIESKLFRDDLGFRRSLFCSWFPALRILRDNPLEFYRQLDSIAAHGYQGVRIFLAVGGWVDFWDNREVVPIRFQKWVFSRESGHLRPASLGPTLEAWPNYDDLLRTLVRACAQRKLRLHVCCGDMQIICPDPGKEIELHQRFARILQEEGGASVVALYETTNEYPLNRYGGDSAESIAQMGRIMTAVRPILPGVLTAQGAGLSEEPDKLVEASSHGEVCVSHTSRDPFSLCIKRTLGLVYWEGNYRAFPKPFWQGEPAGPGQDSYARQDDPANLVALYAMHALTGQHSNWFQGAAVRSFQPLESEWGFKELPSILMSIPEDLGTWEHGSNRSGGIEYWWRGNDFRTSVYKEWDPAPPRPISRWQLHHGTGVLDGIGTPPKGLTGLLSGTFA